MTTSVETFKSREKVQRRRRPMEQSRRMFKGAVVTIVPLIVISSHPSCNFANPIFFVTGLSTPAVRTIGHPIHPYFNDNCHQRNPMPFGHTHYSPKLCFGRNSHRLFESVSFSDDENYSTAVLENAPRNENTKPISIIGDEKELLMNPMEDFDTALKTDAIVFDDDYKKGLITIGFITFLFATNSPVLHWAFTSGENPPPVLLVNAAVSIVALVGLLLGGDTLEDTGTLPSDDTKENNNTDWVGGLELGIWKFLGTTANLFGLALTTASHGALLIQLTTLIVPTTRALVYKESISSKLKISIGLALSGVVCFANDPTGTPSLLGDALCVAAAVCYSAYDLRLYEYGKVVDAVKPLITTKIATQALFSIGLLFFAPPSLFSEGGTAASSSWQESFDYLQTLVTSSEWLPVVTAVVWSGVAVNAVAPFLQVGGQQIVGPTKCQTIYASQPLWAAVLSFVFLGERLGLSGVVGGSAFLIALALAATAETATETRAINIDEAAMPSAACESSTMLLRNPSIISNATVAMIEEVGSSSSSYRS